MATYIPDGRPRSKAPRGAEEAKLVGRAFALMLKVRRELTKNMITYPDRPGMFTIRELSEDNAAIVIQRALLAAERRGAKRTIAAQLRVVRKFSAATRRGKR